MSFFSIPARASIWRFTRLDFDLARIANGWYECKSRERVTPHSFCIARRGINSCPRRPSPLVTWPGIISSMHRHPKRPILAGRALARQPLQRDQPVVRRPGREKPLPWIEGWRGIYDLKTGTFSVPPDFAENNPRRSRRPPRPRSDLSARSAVAGSSDLQAFTDDRIGENRRFSAIGKPPQKAVKSWHPMAKSVCCSPKPLRWPRDAHVLIGPGPEHQEKQL